MVFGEFNGLLVLLTLPFCKVTGKSEASISVYKFPEYVVFEKLVQLFF